MDPFLGSSQGRLAGFCRLEVRQVRWQDGQGRFRNSLMMAILPDNGEWLAPISYAAVCSIKKIVVGGFLAETFSFEPASDSFLGLGSGKAVECDLLVVVINTDAFIDVTTPVFAILRLDNLWNGQVELLSEFQITRVMSRHSHDRSGAIGGQNIVGDPDGNTRLIDRVDGKGAGENACLLLGEFRAFQVATAR